VTSEQSVSIVVELPAPAVLNAIFNANINIKGYNYQNVIKHCESLFGFTTINAYGESWIVSFKDEESMTNFILTYL